MAEIISFVELSAARRRHRHQARSQQCVELIELNLRYELECFAQAELRDRPVHAHRVRLLGELLEYAVRVL